MVPGNLLELVSKMGCYSATDMAWITVFIATAAFGVAAQDPLLLPGSWVAPEAIGRFRKAVEARDRGNAYSAPDKLEDQWTSSQAFRSDLTHHFSGLANNFTVLEVGAYFGYTTRLLSHLFARVIALDALPLMLQANQEYNLDRDNIIFLKFHTVEDDWGLFALNKIHVILLDASHDYATVKLDVEHSLSLSTVSLIIFDDYSAEVGVRAVVHEYIAAGRLRPVALLGEGVDGQPWRLLDGRVVDGSEAIACEVVRPQPISGDASQSVYHSEISDATTSSCRTAEGGA